MMKHESVAPAALATLLLVGCATPTPPVSQVHLKDAPRPTANIPQPVQQSMVLPPPRPAPKTETYSVSVFQVPVQSLLFALARDAKVNIDVHPAIQGEVTLNAIDQTLPQILSRISRQIDMRYELDGPNLTVLPDTPFLRNYKIDYVNIARDSRSVVNIATEVGSGGGTASNSSTTTVENTSNNRFWATLVANVRDILRETDRVLPEGAGEGTSPPTAAPAGTPASVQTGAPIAGAGTAPSATAPVVTPAARPSVFREAASVIANPETGYIAVRATSRQHERIQEFLDRVLASARRQVMIEATVVEVQLNDQYQQGINWARLRNGARGFSLGQEKVSTDRLPSGVEIGTTPGIFLLNYANPTSSIGNISATIQLLESFGKVKVLSSPKISALNNQTALLKVVDNTVYFTITAETETTEFGRTTTYSSTAHTVPVGFVMSVTPQISESDEVTLNVRPTISRIVGFVQDPNPALQAAVRPVTSSIPIVQTREMESVLKVSSGQIAVMGGLMQDGINNRKDGFPGVNQLPFLGDALSYRNENATKTELVIFMRPLVVKNASVDGDFHEFRHLLPSGRALDEQRYGVAGPGAPIVEAGRP